VPVFVDGTCELLAVLLALLDSETMRDRQQICVHQSRLQLHEQTSDGKSGRPESGIEDEESEEEQSQHPKFNMASANPIENLPPTPFCRRVRTAEHVKTN
jgi:hypothetical protein